VRRFRRRAARALLPLLTAIPAAYAARSRRRGMLTRHMPPLWIQSRPLSGAPLRPQGWHRGGDLELSAYVQDELAASG
jgi:hypothetical protein